MRIACVFTEFPSGQISNTTRVFSLAKRGYNITVIANKPGNSKINLGEFTKYKDQIEIIYLNKSISSGLQIILRDFFTNPIAFVKNISFITNKNLMYQHYTKQISGGFGKRGKYLKLGKRTKLLTFYLRKRIFDKNKFDVLIAFFGTVGHNYLFVKKLQPELLYISYFVGFDYSDYVYRMANPNVYADLFETSDIIAVKSNYSKETVIDLGCDRSKVKIDYNGINLEKFSLKKYGEDIETVKFIIVSRLEKKKAHLKILEAFKNIIKVNRQFTFTIVGKGPEEDSIRSFIEEHQDLKSHLFLEGFRSQSEVKELLETHHVFIHPSSISSLNGSMEDTPTAILEAMAIGLPIIGTYHAGIPDLVIDGENGFLVGEKNISGLERSILKFIENRGLIETYGKKSRALAEQKFDAAKNAMFIDQFIN